MGSSLVSRRTTWSIGSVLWVIVLSIFSAFQLWRGAWVDGILFTALTLLLIVDDMLERVMRSRTVRIGVIAAWWWFGWHFIFAKTVDPMVLGG